MTAEEGRHWLGWHFPWLRGMEIISMHQQNLSLVWLSSTGTLFNKSPSSLLVQGLSEMWKQSSSPFQGFLEVSFPAQGSSSAGQIALLPNGAFPQTHWGSWDTPHLSKGRASACSPLLRAFSNTSFKSMLIFSFANHDLCPSLQTKYLHPHHCQDDLQFLHSVNYLYLSSFCLGDNSFGLLTEMSSCIEQGWARSFGYEGK